MGDWRQVPKVWMLVMGACWLGLSAESVVVREWPLWISALGWVGFGGSEILWRTQRLRCEARGWNAGLVIYLSTFAVTGGVAWCGLWSQWAWHAAINERGLLVAFSVAFAAALAVMATFRAMQRARDWPRWSLWLAFTLGVFPVWHWLVFISHHLGWAKTRVACAQGGMALVFISGLLWTVWWVEHRSRSLQLSRQAGGGKSLSRIGPLEAMNRSVASPPARKIWNPFDQDAWYYGRRRQKLKQSFNAVLSYTLVFVAVVMLILGLSGCQEIYELPAGGGEEMLKQKVVKIKKVIRKKFVINPFSAILFNPPPIEQIKLELIELTKHVYQPGQGEGKGAGFAGGTKRGKVGFFRLRYGSGDWDQDLELNSDLNLLLWYAANTGHDIAPKPEVRTLGQIKKFPIGKSPPLVYITGQKTLSLSRNEIETLREYLTDKHGMLFADNGGSAAWHSQFFNLIRQVLPNAEPIQVPFDHPVHRGIPSLPMVVPHGGRVAYGWVVESRLVVYYHPGDIGDAWADGHAGVSRQIYEDCYRLGANIMLYAHSEYSKWLQARKEKDKK